VLPSGSSTESNDPTILLACIRTPCSAGARPARIGGKGDICLFFRVSLE
jgi:hypothetical protein